MAAKELISNRTSSRRFPRCCPGITDIPSGGVSGGTFLAAGPTSGELAILTFQTPINYLSFLWGSPDTYNKLEITSTTGTYDFTVNSLGFAVTDDNQSFSQYVQFTTNPGETILSASFANSPAQDAFETANFSVGAVPEASSWAMMIFGFLGIGLLAYRRSRKRKCVGPDQRTRLQRLQAAFGRSFCWRA